MRLYVFSLSLPLLTIIDLSLTKFEGVDGDFVRLKKGCTGTESQLRDCSLFIGGGEEGEGDNMEVLEIFASVKKGVSQYLLSYGGEP